MQNILDQMHGPFLRQKSFRVLFVLPKLMLPLVRSVVAQYCSKFRLVVKSAPTDRLLFGTTVIHLSEVPQFAIVVWPFKTEVVLAWYSIRGRRFLNRKKIIQGPFRFVTGHGRCVTLQMAHDQVPRKYIIQEPGHFGKPVFRPPSGPFDLDPETAFSQDLHFFAWRPLSPVYGLGFRVTPKGMIEAVLVEFRDHAVVRFQIQVPRRYEFRSMLHGAFYFHEPTLTIEFPILGLYDRKGITELCRISFPKQRVQIRCLCPEAIHLVCLWTTPDRTQGTDQDPTDRTDRTNPTDPTDPTDPTHRSHRSDRSHRSEGTDRMEPYKGPTWLFARGEFNSLSDNAQVCACPGTGSVLIVTGNQFFHYQLT